MFPCPRPGLFLALTLAWLLAGGGAMAAQAQKPGEVRSLLQAFLVVSVADGETFADASKAKPGDTLEYRLTYENGTGGAIRDLQATLPIPAGTAFLPGTAAPAGAQASLDGVQYAAIPLMRDQKQADGTVRKVPVPVEEYRSLRWTVPVLEADAKATLAARVRVR